ncbi:MAG: Maf family protein [Bifidobacterium tibiigranuli]|nr:Maf family protein [Bifidobacterium tibiigranuli]MCI1797734.1 Maf family protein [Bifidobacterium tibiigranuli]
MSIPVVLASQSPSRRDVLYTAGVCPIIRVSHVDEPAALERAAAQSGVTVQDLGIEQRVMILAQAKAQAVFRAYRDVAGAADEAHGDQVTAYPLQAVASSRETSEANDDNDNDTKGSEPAERSTFTRDFSGIDVPTASEPIAQVPANRDGIAHSAVGPLIIGCDSMFLFDGECYGKPHDADVAQRRLRAMRGHDGELWTGHCIIDFATEHVSRGASHATVRFGDYSDQEIERYIATGEPLEVAGSFTLEGFGSAFIEGIDGDPHGVMGVSLPLLRHLTAQLDIEWTDLWNVSRGVPAGTSKKDATQPVPPKETVHQPGDGWVSCACGRRHWGTNGAAGVLLARRDPQTGAVSDIVMQHRAVWSAEGGTWGIPGGAIADGESPIEGALRESFEEANITSQDIEVVGSYREEHGPWAYTTVFAFEKPGRRVMPCANDDESLEIEWVPFDQVPDRRLLTALRTDWPNFAARLQKLAAAHGVLHAAPSSAAVEQSA